VLWIDGARTKRPVAMAHMTHPAEGVLRIGPVHVAVRVPAPPIARHPSLRGREEKYPQLMALAQQAEESIPPCPGCTPLCGTPTGQRW
jgi:hypothetical protein